MKGNSTCVSFEKIKLHMKMQNHIENHEWLPVYGFISFDILAFINIWTWRIVGKCMNQIRKNVFCMNHRGLSITLHWNVPCLSLLTHLNDVIQITIFLPDSWSITTSLFHLEIFINTTNKMKFTNNPARATSDFFSWTDCREPKPNKKAQAYFGSKLRSLMYWWTFLRNSFLTSGNPACMHCKNEKYKKTKKLFC